VPSHCLSIFKPMVEIKLRTWTEVAWVTSPFDVLMGLGLFLAANCRPNRAKQRSEDMQEAPNVTPVCNDESSYPCIDESKCDHRAFLHI
jgi:hypothetical protein